MSAEGAIVHRVSVLFHAQDRLTRHLDGFAAKFTGLNKLQTEFEKKLREVARMQDRLGKLNDRNAAATFAADTRKLRMEKQMEDAKRRNIRLMEMINKREQALMEKTFNKEQEFKAKALALDEQFAAKRAAIQDKYRGKFDAFDASHTKLTQKGARLLSVNQVKRRTEMRDNLRSQLERISNERKSAMLQAEREALANGGTRATADAEMALAAVPFNKKMAALRPQLALEERLVANHHALIALDEKRTILLAQQEAEVVALHEKHSAYAHDQLKDLRAEMAGNTAAMEQQNERHRMLIDHRQEEQNAMEAAHARELEALEAEAALRERNIALLTQNVAEEEKKEALLRAQVAHAEKLNAAFAKMTVGAGMALGGGMALAAELHLGRKLAEHGSELQTSWGNFGRMGVSKEENARLKAYVDKSKGVVGGMIVPGSEQYKMLTDMIGTGMKPDEALALLPSMVQTTRLISKVGEGHENAGDMTKNLAAFLDKTGKVSASEREKLIGQWAQANLASGGRLSSSWLKAFTQKGMTFQGTMHANMSNLVPILDFMSGLGSGGTAGTAFQSIYKAVGMHGTSPKAQKYWAQTGLAKKLFNDKHEVTGLLGIGDAMLKQAHVTRDLQPENYDSLSKKDKIDINDQSQRLLHVVQQAFPNMLASNTVAMISGIGHLIAQRDTHRVSQSMTAAAAIQAGFGASYANKLQDQENAWKRMQETLGVQLLPLMTKWTTGMTALIQTFTDFTLLHPRLVATTAAIVFGGTALVTLIGVFKMVQGATQLLTLLSTASAAAKVTEAAATTSVVTASRLSAFNIGKLTTSLAGLSAEISGPGKALLVVAAFSAGMAIGEAIIAGVKHYFNFDLGDLSGEWDKAHPQQAVGGTTMIGADGQTHAGGGMHINMPPGLMNPRYANLGGGTHHVHHVIIESKGDGHANKVAAGHTAKKLAEDLRRGIQTLTPSSGPGLISVKALGGP